MGAYGWQDEQPERRQEDHMTTTMTKVHSEKNIIGVSLDARIAEGDQSMTTTHTRRSPRRTPSDSPGVEIGLVPFSQQLPIGAVRPSPENTQLYQPIAPAAPDLAEVLTAWPTLPEALKAGIVAMVKAACPMAGKRGE